MQWKYLIDAVRRLMYVRVWGPASVADFQAAQREVAASPLFDSTHAVILDMRDLDMSDLSPADVEALARRTIYSPTSRRAIVADTAGRFGVARMYEIRRELAGGSEQIRVVPTLQDALRWLGIEDGELLANLDNKAV